MKRILTAVSAAMLLLPALASADSGFYAGLGAGASRLELDLASNGLLPPSGDPLDSDSFKGNSFAFKAMAGYQLFDFLAFEVAYLDLGDSETNACFVNNNGDCLPNPGNPFPQLSNEGNPWNVEIPLQGWTIEAVGILPLGEQWDVFAKLGVFIWDADITARDDVASPPSRPLPSPLPENYPLITTTADGEDLTVGLGGSFHATEHISVRLEFQWFDISDADSVWTGLVTGIYRF